MDLTQRLAGKVAVITGGAGGIGLASARRMRAEGATIVIGEIDAKTGKAAADEVDGLFVPVDVSDEAAVNNLFDTAADTYGSVDIAFNNAGISPPDDDVIETTELPAWQKVQDINLKSVYLSCRAALRHMVPAEKGSIINTASFVAVMGSCDVADLLHGVKGRRPGNVPRARGSIRAQRYSRQRAVPGAGEHAVAEGAGSRRTPSGLPDGWYTCRWDGSPSRRNWLPRSHSWPATMPRSSPARRSSSTAVSVRPTSPRCRES